MSQILNGLKTKHRTNDLYFQMKKNVCLKITGNTNHN